MNRSLVLAVLGSFTLLAGCGGSKVSPIAQNAPEWVNKGSGAFKEKDGKQVF